VVSIQSVLDINTMGEKEEANSFKLNDIGKVTLKMAKPIFADRYRENPRNGAFILIDEFSNNTVSVGMIESF
jgi:sulfate adenylyltransferase subunit 1